MADQENYPIADHQDIDNVDEADDEEDYYDEDLYDDDEKLVEL
jgi:hypothetical protein